jgi:hypothetical protein
MVGRVVVVLIAVVSVIACSGSDGSVSPTPRVGQACSAATSCGPGERCLTGEPGGLCVKPCTTSGSAAECPSGSFCDEDSFARDDGSGDQRLTVCLQACQKDEECRAGYACSGASNATGKVCRKRGS